MSEVEIHIDKAGFLRDMEVVAQRTARALALKIERDAKTNIRNNDQIDTGFMVNSVYTIWDGEDTYGDAISGAYNLRTRSKSAGMRKSKRTRQRVSVATRQVVKEELPDGALAAVVVGANYAVYQEAKKPFLYPAGEKAQSVAEKIFQEAYREVMGGE